MSRLPSGPQSMMGLETTGGCKTCLWVNPFEGKKAGVFIHGIHALSFPGGSDSKESACNAGDPGSIPGSGRSPGEGNGDPLQYSCLENPMDRGAWQATVHGIARVGWLRVGWLSHWAAATTPFNKVICKDSICNKVSLWGSIWSWIEGSTIQPSTSTNSLHYSSRQWHAVHQSNGAVPSSSSTSCVWTDLFQLSASSFLPPQPLTHAVPPACNTLPPNISLVNFHSFSDV